MSLVMRFLSLLALLTGSFSVAVAQDRAATEQRLSTIRSQITTAESQVRSARGEEQDALQALERLDTELALREELVNSYSTELATLRSETETLRASIQDLDAEIERARQEYRDLATHAYKRSRVSLLAIILSAQSVPQMLARARYLQRFASQRRRQVNQVREKTAQLRARRSALEESLQTTRALLTQSRSEQVRLRSRRKERATLVREVRSRRGRLERELAQRRTDAQRLEGLVQELIAEERRRRQAAEAARRAAEREAARAEANRAESVEPAPETATPAPRAPAATPPESRSIALTGSFLQNRGSLPWPASGTVTGNFGSRRDPVYGTTVEVPGIDLSTAPGAPARAVFEGVVERVGAMATFGTYVMISHGDFTTIYGNLSQVVVRRGQSVSAGTAVGRTGTSDERRGAALFFALFRNGQPIDPVGWLRPR